MKTEPQRYLHVLGRAVSAENHNANFGSLPAARFLAIQLPPERESENARSFQMHVAQYLFRPLAD
jgi:hypothetical protein